MPTLVCPTCQHRERLAVATTIGKLQQIGMLRREAEVDEALVWELFRSALPRLKCAECQAVGQRLDTKNHRLDDEFDVPTLRLCEDCSSPISPERLEVLPSATLCLSCQKKSDDDQVVLDEFCPKCGDRLQVRKTSASVTKYSFYCPACGRV